MNVEAQLRTVDSGELQFGFPEDMDLGEVKDWVIRQAQIRALAAEFGTRVRSESVYSVSDANGEVDDAFTELSVSQVKGEWVRTLEEEGPFPEVEGQEIFWRVRVKGQARPLKESRVDLEFTLVSDPDARTSIEALNAGDRIRCGFLSPVDGFLLLFYVEDEVVNVLARDAKAWSVAVEGQQTYSLFTPDHEWRAAGLSRLGLGRLPGYDSEFGATNDGVTDASGMLIAAFSTDRFPPPIVQGSGDLFTLDEGAFERWVKKRTGESDAFQLTRQPVRIRAKDRY